MSDKDRDSGPFGEHIRHNLAGYVALFCFAIGGTAIALPGKNKVDSGDIRNGNVRASDLARGSVTEPKLADDAVATRSVSDDSLTGADIREGSLDLPGVPPSLPPSEAAGGDLAGEYPNPQIAPGSVGNEESADSLRVLTFSPADLVLGNPPPAPGFVGNLPSLDFDPDMDEIALLTIRVPSDRVEGTPLQIRYQWSADGPAGLVYWGLHYLALASGESAMSLPSSAEGTADAAAPAEQLVSSPITFLRGLQIPGSAIMNGELLVLTIYRDANASIGDTLPVDASLHAVDVEYTAVR